MIKVTFGGRHHHCECRCNLGFIDETLLIIENQSTQKRGNVIYKMEGPTSKKINEPPRGKSSSQTFSSCEKYVK
jgi:hypothetical protein